MNTVYERLFLPGEVVEIRGIGLHGKNSGWVGFARETVVGYFDNAADFGKCAALLDKAGATGVYFTLNPVNPALLARSCNRLKVMKYTTQDKDIVCIRWLPIDLDPIRPAGISATNEEVAQAKDMARTVAAWMEADMKFPRAVRGFSGNGWHLLYRLPDMTNNDETHQLVVSSIANLAEKFKNDKVDLDVSVVNPARIWKLYGTTGRKGDSTPERPHRKSYLLPPVQGES